jgi:hypothetical protein
MARSYDALRFASEGGKEVIVIIKGLIALLLSSSLAFAADTSLDYRVLATNKTSTMEKEMNDVAEAGYRFDATMGGESAFGGSEVIVVMARDRNDRANGRYRYKLLATNKTSTMQKELQDAADEGFIYKGQTVFKTAFGGQEVVVILESDRQAPQRQYEYKLLATSKTSTMQKELQEAAGMGFVLAGMTVGKTAFGGKELVTILHREIEK